MKWEKGNIEVIAEAGRVREMQMAEGEFENKN